MRGHRVRIALGLAAVVVAGVVAAAPPRYVAVPLGTLGGKGTGAMALNDAGAVVGFSFTKDDAERHAFVFDDAGIHDLGTMGGTFSTASGINAAGVICGYSWTGSATFDILAVVVEDGTMRDIGSLGGNRSVAEGINAQGDIVGSSVTPDGLARGFIWRAGTMTTIGVLGTGRSSQAMAINDAGQVTGYSEINDSGQGHGYLYADGKLRDIGTLGGMSSYPYGMNAGGDITGWASDAHEEQHAFVWHDGHMRDLGTLGGEMSWGFALNDAGVVVGAAETRQDQRAFVYVDGTMYDLNTLIASGVGATTLTVAHAINNHGQIVAYGCMALGVCESFRLDPVTDATPLAARAQVVEYYHAGMDHYFMTADPREVAALDGGQFVGWERTGQSFAAYAAPTVGADPVCRLYSAGFSDKSSHFYSSDPGVCVYVQTYPGWSWQSEGTVMGMPSPGADGACAAGTVPVYRLYNDGQGGAPNHRYTVDASVRAAMMARGWIPEGAGPLGVVMCAPAQP